jgi:hypothetical protein
MNFVWRKNLKLLLAGGVVLVLAIPLGRACSNTVREHMVRDDCKAYRAFCEELLEKCGTLECKESDRCWTKCRKEYNGCLQRWQMACDQEMRRNLNLD